MRPGPCWERGSPGAGGGGGGGRRGGGGGGGGTGELPRCISCCSGVLEGWRSIYNPMNKDRIIIVKDSQWY